MDLGSIGFSRVLRPPTHTHPRGQAREGNPQATCPTLPCTQLDHWAPLGAPRGGTAGPKSWPKSFGPKLFFLVAFWPKIPPNGPNAPLAVPLSHTKCGGYPGRQTPTPTGALSVPIVGETHLGQAGIWGQSWQSTGDWVERLWKAEESSGSMGSIELQRAEAL
jgi:hypothetical protein